MLPTQACASHTSPQGCFVHHWNVCVECCLQLHPICTMCTMPIHKVPAYAHQPISHLSMVGAPLCAHHTPFPSTFCQFSHTQVLPCMFQILSHRCIWMQLPTLSPTVSSDSSSTPAPEALLLGGWHTHWRPTTTLQLPLAMFCSHACAHLHLCPDRTAFGPACLSLPFPHLPHFDLPLAPNPILPLASSTHSSPTT